MATFPNKYLSSLSTWALPGLFSKEKEIDLDKNEPIMAASEAKLEAEAKKAKEAGEKAIADAAKVQTPVPNANPAAPAKVDAKEVSSPAVIALVAKLPQDTLSKLCEVQQDLIKELDRMLAKPERLTRLGQWEKANSILNDLKLIRFQINTLVKAKAKNLSKEETAAVGGGEKRIEALAKLAVHDNKIRKLSETLHKKLVEYQHRETEASEEAVLELLSSKDYKTILSEYAARTKKHALMLTMGSQALYVASNFGLLSELASQFHPLLGLAVAIPEGVVAWSPGPALAAPLLAPITALGSDTISRASDTLFAPAYYVAEELYNLKDAATDTAQFIGDSVNCVYGHAKQTVTVCAITGAASLTARVVAQTGIISSAVGTLAPEVAFFVRGAEQATLLLTEGLNPLTPAGFATIGAGSFAASTMLIDNPNIKKPSTKQIRYSVPKAADFIRKAAIVTTVAATLVAAHVYAPSMAGHAVSNITSVVGNSVSTLTSLFSGNSTGMFSNITSTIGNSTDVVSNISSATGNSTDVDTYGKIISRTVDEVIGQTAIFVAQRTALTATAIYTAQNLPGLVKTAQNLPGLVKKAVVHGISKVGGSLPIADSAKSSDKTPDVAGTPKPNDDEPSAPAAAPVSAPAVTPTSSSLRDSRSSSSSSSGSSSAALATSLQDDKNDSKDPVDAAGIEDESDPSAVRRNSAEDNDGFIQVMSKNQRRKFTRGHTRTSISLT